MKQLLICTILIINIGIFSWMVSFQHGNRPSGCSLDGSEIHPQYEVIIVQKDTLSKSFSCVLTACIWFRENSEEVSSILVTDEVTGEKIKAEGAFFVVSEVVTTPYTGNRIHVFADMSEARSHAMQFNGKLVKTPFQVEEKIKVLVAEHRTYPRSGPGFLFPSSQNPLSLPVKIVLIKQQDSSSLPQEYPARFSDGYSNPPDRPPRTLI